VTTSLPAAPPGSGAAGKRLWRSVLAEFELSGADLVILAQAVVVTDEIEALRPMLALGPFIKDKDGQPRVNPAQVQHRLLSITLARLLSVVQVVGELAGEEHDPARPQKRAGVRGVYGLRAVP
jgi:hypothetical protein